MSLRWLLFDYVDPELPITAQERKLVRKRSMNKAGGMTPAPGVSRGVMIVAALVPATCMLISMGIFMTYFRGSYIGIAIALAIQIALSWLFLAYLGRFTWRPLVCAELRRMGHDVCLHCGYWLRGLNDDVKQCPECGAQREGLPS